MRLAVLPLLAVALTAAVVEGAQFTLTWSDNSANEAGFRIERSTNGSSFTEIATVGANVVSYVDVGLPNSTTYWYRVRAFNAAGNSTYSNVATGTTPPPPTNSAPTITSIANQSINGGSTTGALAFTVGDAETAAGSLTVTRASSNTTLVPLSGAVLGGSGANRSITVTPASGQTGTATITVTVGDGALSTSTSFTVTVNAVNTAPTISSISNRTINEDTSTGAISFTVGDGETAAGSLTLTGTSSNTTLLPNAAIVFGGNGSNRTVTLSPAANQSGSTSVTITVSDGALTASRTFTLTVSAVNDAPTISGISNRAINQDTNTGAIGFTVADVETAASSLTLSGASSNTVLVPVSGIAFGGTGSNRTVTVTPAAGQSGTATITVTVSDGFLTASSAFTLTVNAVNTAPTITSIANQTVESGGNTGALAFTIGDAQTAAGSLTVTRSSSNTTLVPLSGAVLGGSGANRTITVTPASGQTGTATITVTVSDGSLSTNTSFTVTVTAANTAPTITSIANQSLESGGNTGALAFTIGDAQTAAGSLTVTRSSSNTTLVPLSGAILGGSGANRTITVTPASGRTGTATITVTVSDGSLSTNTSFTVTVTAANTAPTITSIANQSLESGGNTGALAFTIGDAQTAAGSLTVTRSSSNTTLVPLSGAVLGGSGANRTITVTPASGQTGTATITVTVSDGSLSANTSFTVTVTAANTAPTITSIANQTVESGGNTGALAFTIGDAQTAAGSLFVYALSSNTTLAPVSRIGFTGTGANRTVTVTPATGETGTATITVTVSDGTLTASTSFTLTVNDSTASPVITSQPESVTVTAGASASFAVVASGTPTPAYQWRRNGVVIAGATTATYSIPSAQASDAGNYTVVVSNSAGSVTSSGATLTVNPAITITSQPVSQTIARNTTATLSVTATGAALSYQWYTGSSGNTGSPIAGATSASYTTPRLSSTSEYWVRVSSSGQSVNSSTARVSVVNRMRFASGRFELNFGAREVLAAPPANAAADGTFALMIGEDGVLQMLAIDSSSGLVIDAGGAPLGEDGTFSFAVTGLGTVAGQVVDGVVTGAVVGSNVTFVGHEDAISGDTATLAGWYEAAIVNSSDGEIILLVGPAGRGFVLSYSDGQVTGGLVSVSADGSVLTTLPNGRSLALSVEGGVGRVSGSTQAGGVSRPVSGVRAGVAAEKRLVNTSVRAQVRSGDGLMVAGFVVSGSGEKRMLIRAVGPTLGDFGLGGVLADPVVRLFRQGDPAGAPPIAINDNWSAASNSAEVAAVTSAVGAFALPVGSRDAALLVTLPAGAYTAQVSGAGGGTGLAIVEVYDADAGTGVVTMPSQLANISMRGIAGSGNDLVIAGFVVTGNTPKRVLVRAVGPELGAFGVSGVAPDPLLMVYERVEGQEVHVVTNNDWSVDAAAVSAAGDHVGAFPLTAGSRSSAVVLWLAPGVYTAQASSNNGTSGVAIVEVYEIE